MLIVCPSHAGCLSNPYCFRYVLLSLCSIFESRCCQACPSSFFTIAEMAVPSAFPASCFVATPITFPMSFIDVAPVCAMMVLTASSISSGVKGFGRYSSMTATCASSASARSALFYCLYVSADSFACFASFCKIFIALLSLSVSFAPGAVFASRKTFFTLRRVSRRTLSRAFIASLMSFEIWSKSIVVLFGWRVAVFLNQSDAKLVISFRLCKKSVVFFVCHDVDHHTVCLFHRFRSDACHVVYGSVNVVFYQSLDRRYVCVLYGEHCG